MGLLDKIKGFLKPLPQQQEMNRLEDVDPATDEDNTLHGPGDTYPNPSLEEDVRPPAE